MAHAALIYNAAGDVNIFSQTMSLLSKTNSRYWCHFNLTIWNQVVKAENFPEKRFTFSKWQWPIWQMLEIGPIYLLMSWVYIDQLCKCKYGLVQAYNLFTFYKWQRSNVVQSNKIPFRDISTTIIWLCWNNNVSTTLTRSKLFSLRDVFEIGLNLGK